MSTCQHYYNTQPVLVSVCDHTSVFTQTLSHSVPCHSILTLVFCSYHQKPPAGDGLWTGNQTVNRNTRLLMTRLTWGKTHQYGVPCSLQWDSVPASQSIHLCTFLSPLHIHSMTSSSCPPPPPSPRTPLLPSCTSLLCTSTPWHPPPPIPPSSLLYFSTSTSWHPPPTHTPTHHKWRKWSILNVFCFYFVWLKNWKLYTCSAFQ